MGQRALRWSFVADYVRALQALVRGDVVSWENAPIQMLHSPGMAPERPITVRWLIGAAGPKGVAVAHEFGDGVFTAGTPPPPGFDWSVSLVWGTVLAEGESADSERALAAAGHAGAVMLHGAYEHSPLAQEQLREWLVAYETVGEDRRHLAMHYGHLVHLNSHDAPHVTVTCSHSSASPWRPGDGRSGLPNSGRAARRRSPSNPRAPTSAESSSHSRRSSLGR